jgi:hypothetical protein
VQPSKKANLASGFLLFLSPWNLTTLTVPRLVTATCFVHCWSASLGLSRVDINSFLFPEKEYACCRIALSASRFGLSRLGHPLVSPLLDV